MPIDDKTAYTDDSDILKIDPLPHSDKPRSKLINLINIYFSYYCSKNNSKGVIEKSRK